jgi:hypothetical protein
MQSSKQTSTQRGLISTSSHNMTIRTYHAIGRVSQHISTKSDTRNLHRPPPFKLNPIPILHVITYVSRMQQNPTPHPLPDELMCSRERNDAIKLNRARPYSTMIEVPMLISLAHLALMKLVTNPISPSGMLNLGWRKYRPARGHHSDRDTTKCSPRRTICRGVRRDARHHLPVRVV